jgi:penicillin amidase
MRWVALESAGNELTSFIKLNKAKSFNDFKEALRYFYAPGQNFLYADNKGNIGYFCGARIPIRNNNSPSFVYDGTLSQNDWKGYVPFEAMPTFIIPQKDLLLRQITKLTQSLVTILPICGNLIQELTELQTFLKAKISTR